MHILIEDLEGSLWCTGVDKRNKIQSLEIDPYTEILRWGSVYTARVSRIDAGQNVAFIDLGFGFEGYLRHKDVRIDGKKPDPGKKIGQILRPGQMIIVQVKTPFNPAGVDSTDTPGNTLENPKLSAVSMDIALSGRYLIHTPFSDHNRVSKRIRNKELRKNIKAMADSIADINGCILRASAANCQTDMLVREGKILKAIWDNLKAVADEPEPTLLMMGPNAVQRTLGDMAGRQIDSIAVSTMDIFTETEEWCDLFAPDLMTKIEPRAAENTRSGMGLFETHDLIGQLEEFLHPVVPLPSGGTIIIEETSAMTVIDVNSGRDSNSFNANVEAAREIARQIRLRNIGGTIVVDFIRMGKKKDADKILHTLEDALDGDPCTAECHGMTALGLFEITRKRRTPPLDEKLLMLGDLE